MPSSLQFRLSSVSAVPALPAMASAREAINDCQWLFNGFLKIKVLDIEANIVYMSIYIYIYIYLVGQENDPTDVLL